MVHGMDRVNGWRRGDPSPRLERMRGAGAAPCRSTHKTRIPMFRRPLPTARRVNPPALGGADPSCSAARSDRPARPFHPARLAGRNPARLLSPPEVGQGRSDLLFPLSSLLSAFCERSERGLWDTPRNIGGVPRTKRGTPRKSRGVPRKDGGTPRITWGTPRNGGGDPRTGGGDPRTGGGAPRTKRGDPRTGGGAPRTKRGTPRNAGGFPRKRGGVPR
jgi:hypothetical protein